VSKVAYTAAEIKTLMERVLREYLRLGVIGAACDNAGLPRKTHMQWMKKYPRYAELINEVKEKFIDGLEVVAMERAREKSDSLMQLMLKAHRREVYGDKTEMELKGKGVAAPITLVFAEGMLNANEKKLLEGGPVDEQSDSPSDE
jgi:hypothetical protein